MQSRGIHELGVGINILPHAIKELVDLGLLDELDRVAIRTQELIYMNRFGQEIWREPRGWRPGVTCRSSPSTAAGCKACCTTRPASGWDPAPSTTLMRAGVDHQRVPYVVGQAVRGLFLWKGPCQRRGRSFAAPGGVLGARRVPVIRWLTWKLA